MKRKSLTITVATVAMISLAGCGTQTGERTVSGAGIGAGAGAVIGALTGVSVLNGALLGAAAGGAAGLISDPNKVNLGKPAWE
jgi:hypothetical protein